MILAMEWLLVVLAVLGSLPGVLLLSQALLAALPSRWLNSSTSDRRPSTAVLIPAHNEAAGIASTVRSVASQLRANDYVIVVADNCSDDTAAAAAAAGARTAQRTDAEKRGKGYALAFGMSEISKDPRDVVLVIDADTLMQPGCLPALSDAASATAGPVQAINLLAAPAGSSVVQRVSAFAFLFKNLVRTRGFSRLGLPCQLLGTGMAFPYALLAAARLGTADIVEDMGLGIEMATKGHPPLLCTAATVTGVLPTGGDASMKQRTRWEHGHLHTILKRAAPLAMRGIITARPSLVLMALDLAVPPLALLVTLQFGLLAVCLLGMLLGIGPAAALVAGGGVLFTALAVILGWWCFGRGTISFTQLCTVPLYIAWKLPMYLRFINKRQTAWVRTARDGESGLTAEGSRLDTGKAASSSQS